MKTVFRPLLPFALTVVLLGGCSSSESFNDVQVGTTAPAPIVPRTALAGVALNGVADPDILLSLQRVLNVNSQAEPDVRVHDALLVEGSSGVPDSAKIDEFLEAGKSVIFLNASEADKRSKLAARSLVSTAGASRALAMRRSQDRFGRSEFFISEWRDGRTSAEQFEDALERHLTATSNVGVSVLAQSSGGFDPPPGLIYATFNYSYTGPSESFDTTFGGEKSFSPSQHTSLVCDFNFLLMLENGQVATGQRQWLVLESALRSSPLNPAVGSNQLLATVPGDGLTKSDMGWFQTELLYQVTPSTPANFRWQADSPANVNGDTQVQTSLNLSLDIASPDGGGGVTFGYSKSVTTDITDWEVQNLGGGNSGSWRYANQNPYDDDTPDEWGKYGPGGGLEGFGKQRTPNNLASGELSADTQIAFTSQSLLTSTEQFNTSVTQEFSNAYSKDFGIVRSDQRKTVVPVPFLVDMSAVVPIPISSITFDPSQGRPSVSNQVEATITLASPAKVDTVVALLSNSQNAVVLPTVTIPQGKRSATFQVLVNANGLSQGASTVATITASYGPAFETQLTVQN